MKPIHTHILQNKSRIHDITSQKGQDATVELNADGNLYVNIKDYQFDLKLIKRIVEVNGTKVPERLHLPCCSYHSELLR